MTPTACTHGAVMRNLCFQCSMYDIIDERDALRERVQGLETVLKGIVDYSTMRHEAEKRVEVMAKFAKAALSISAGEK